MFQELYCHNDDTKTTTQRYTTTTPYNNTTPTSFLLHGLEASVLTLGLVTEAVEVALAARVIEGLARGCVAVEVEERNDRAA